jgi:hypothetical protein
VLITFNYLRSPSDATLIKLNLFTPARATVEGLSGSPALIGALRANQPQPLDGFDMLCDMECCCPNEIYPVGKNMKEFFWLNAQLLHLSYKKYRLTSVSFQINNGLNSLWM